jgi:excisionase family DNA binding protein
MVSKSEPESDTTTVGTERILRETRKRIDEILRKRQLQITPITAQEVIILGDEIMLAVEQTIPVLVQSLRDTSQVDDAPISTAEAAKLLFVSCPHVVKLIEEGALRVHHVIGQNRFVLTSSVLTYKAKKEADAKAYFATQAEDSEPLGL